MTPEEAIKELARRAEEMLAERQRPGAQTPGLRLLLDLVRADLDALDSFEQARGSMRRLGLGARAPEELEQQRAWLVGVSRSMALLAACLHATLPETGAEPTPPGVVLH